MAPHYNSQAAGRRQQEAESRRQKAGGRKQEAEGNGYYFQRWGVSLEIALE